ncbi:MAG: sporulation protein YqfD, partial [Oscillospiraceae bacterium]|nr:sporulation protein YqfD [Oscillospiraceae bacterium]
MFLIKIFKFLKGYVIITLRGFFIERFINICTVRNIGLWDIKKSNPSFAVMKISARDFKRIRQVARKTHTVVRIKQKRGLKFFVSGYKKRYALFIGIMLFVFSCAVLPRFIWTVDIEGCETISRDEMSKVLHEAGIYAGVRKSTLKTPQEIRDIVMNRFDNITWAWIYINGSHAVMKIEERAEIPEITDKTQTGDIIALKDGVISKITVKEGKALVFPGNAVMAGDTLIAGNITTKDGTPRSVHALGEAEAFTYYSESRDVKLYEDIR